MNDAMQDVIDFISHFKGAEETFLHGCCYWFAWILKERFNEHGYLVEIYHEPIEGHFVAMFIREPDCEWFKHVGNHDKEYRFFDIRGDVTDLYNEDDLENVWVLQHTDERRWGRLMCDCREFIQPEDYPAWLKQ